MLLGSMSAPSLEAHTTNERVTTHPPETSEVCAGGKTLSSKWVCSPPKALFHGWSPAHQRPLAHWPAKEKAPGGGGTNEAGTELGMLQGCVISWLASTANRHSAQHKHKKRGTATPNTKATSSGGVPRPA